ncbi:TPA: IclR family transcriptional regulator [Pseudomonas aeruginosa]
MIIDTKNKTIWFQHMKKEANPPATNTTGTQSVGRALEVLRLISNQNRDGMRLSEVAERCELSKPTAHRLLRELTSSGLVILGAGHRYHLGQFAYELGLVASARFHVRDVCAPHLERIAHDTGDTVFLVMRSGFDSFCLARYTGDYPIKVFSVEVGNRQPLGVGAGGLALLSYLPESVRREALDYNDARLKTYNGLSSDALESLIRTTREHGYSEIANFAVPGVSGVGVPVLDRVGQPIVAMSVTTISSRMTSDHKRRVLSVMNRERQDLREALFRNVAP